jgi:hypothetical protein
MWSYSFVFFTGLVLVNKYNGNYVLGEMENFVLYPSYNLGSN